LQALFAETRPSLGGEKFVARLRARLKRERWQRQVYTLVFVAICVALALKATPSIMSGTSVVVTSASSMMSDVVGTSVGWAISLLIGGIVLRRLRVFRR
jgi:dolichol kinase